MTETRKFNLRAWVLMHITRYGGNAIKAIVGVQLFIAGQMAADAHTVQERLLLKQISSLEKCNYFTRKKLYSIYKIRQKNYTVGKYR